MAFRQLTFGEATLYRPVIQHFLSAFAPDGADETYSRILSGHVQCWALLAVLDGVTAPIGIAITKVLDDAVTGKRVLFKDVVSVAPGLEQSVWSEADAILDDWGRAHGCTRTETIIANPVLLSRTQEMGYTVVGTLVAKELD